MNFNLLIQLQFTFPKLYTHLEKILIFRCLVSLSLTRGSLCCLGFDSLLEAKRLPDLATLYQLLSRIKGGLDELCIAFSNYIKVIGLDCLQPCQMWILENKGTCVLHKLSLGPNVL